MASSCHSMKRPWLQATVLTSLALVLLLFLTTAATTTAAGPGLFGKKAGASPSLYEELNLAKGATKAEIKKAFRAITREHHPDLKETYDEKEAAKTKMAAVLRAYEVLSDDAKRVQYDEAGIIPGEAPNIDDMTPDELFKHYHQSSPIFSKSTALASVEELRRLLNFRGERVFLVHVYDEVKCKSCRAYSTAWETMYQSSLVESGILNMYRIDGLSDEGKALIKELGIYYRNEPYVFAIVDGERWTLYSIMESLKQKNDRHAFQHLLDFVMSFFYDIYQGVTSLEVMQLDDILTYLRAARPAKMPLRVLLPRITAESIPIALQMNYPQAQIRSVPRDVLLEFVEEYCEMEVDVRDRFGESIPMPEFILVSQEPLPPPPSDVTIVDADGDVSAEEEVSANPPEKSCRLIQIGASVALTYSKASTFLETYLPDSVAGMAGIARADAFHFFDICRVNCILWARQDCTTTPDPAVITLLKESYLSFKTGYLCLNQEPVLAKALAAAGLKVPSTAEGGVRLLVLMGSNDSIIYPLSSLHDTPLSELQSHLVDAALLELLEKERGDASTTAPAPTLRLEKAVSLLLHSEGFPMSYKQRLYVQASTIFSFVKPFISGVWPFFAMYIVHKYVINRQTPEQKAAEEQKKKEEEEAKRAKTEEAADLPVRRRIRKPQPQVAPYNPRDMQWAKEEKGFLLFLVEERPVIAGSLPLPRIAMTAAFSVRILGTGQGRWREWIMAHKPDSTGEAPAGDIPEAERGLTIMAIRKTRMRAMVKSDNQSIDAFLRDLLDGTKNPNEELPSWAYDTE